MFCNESYCNKITFINKDIYNFYSENLDNVIQEGEELFKLNNRILSLNYSFLKEDSIFNENAGDIVKKIKDFIVSLIKAIKNWLAKVFAPIINIFKKKQKDTSTALNEIKEAENNIPKNKEEEVKKHYKNTSPKVKQAVIKLGESNKKIKSSEKTISEAEKNSNEDNNNINNIKKLSDEKLKELNDFRTESAENSFKEFDATLAEYDNIVKVLTIEIKEIISSGVVSYDNMYLLDRSLTLTNSGYLNIYERNIHHFEELLSKANNFLNSNGEQLNNEQISFINKAVSNYNKYINYYKQLIQKLTNVVGAVNSLTNLNKDKLFKIIGTGENYNKENYRKLMHDDDNGLTSKQEKGLSAGRKIYRDYEKAKNGEKRLYNPFFSDNDDNN